MICLNLGTCFAICVVNVLKFRHFHQFLKQNVQAFIDKNLENVQPKGAKYLEDFN